jgi:hypothetical protein
MHSPKKAPKIFVFTNKIAFMQRLSDYVRTGHQAYISGLTAAEKMVATFDKLAAAHPIFDDRLQAFRAREQGLPTGRLLMWLPEKGDQIHWFLLVHGRLEQLDPNEKWRHAEDPHNRIALTGYELIRERKPGLKKPSWTWKYKSDRYQDLRDSIVMAIRSNRDQDLKILIEKLSGTAGFSGSRKQAKDLIALIKSEWALRRPSEQMPDLPIMLGWARRKGDKGIWLQRPKMQPPAPVIRTPNFGNQLKIPAGFEPSKVEFIQPKE